jgi:hypothetical protein
MSRQSDLEKQMRADRDRIVGGIHDCRDTIDRLVIELEVLDRHLGAPTDASSGFDSIVASPQSQPAPHRTRKSRKTMVENDPPAEAVLPVPTRYICGQGHGFDEPGKQKIKGGGTVPCCPVLGCQDLDVTEIK